MLKAYQDRMKAMDDELDACEPQTLIVFIQIMFVGLLVRFIFV